MTDVTDEARTRETSMTATEATIRDMWVDLLGLAEVDTADDFFKLGATSLTAIKFLQRVETEFGADVLLPDTLYDDPRLASVAAAIDETKATGPST